MGTQTAHAIEKNHIPHPRTPSITPFSVWKPLATQYSQEWTSTHLLGCLLRKLSFFYMRLWGRASWIRRNSTTLLSSARCHLGNLAGQFCGIHPHKGSTVVGQILYSPAVYRNQDLSPTCDGQGLGGSAGGGGNTPDLVAEKENIYC